MSRKRGVGTDQASSDRGVLAVAGVALLAVACCAGAPAIVALVGSVALGSGLGWAVGAAGFVLLLTVAVVLARRRLTRRSAAPTTPAG